MSQTQRSFSCKYEDQIVQSPTQRSIIQSELQRSLSSNRSSCHQIVLRFGFLHLPGFLLRHLHSVLLLLGFIFVLFLLFDFRLVRATASQSQTDPVHNFIVKVRFFFFFFGDAFLVFFFFWFLKIFHVLCSTRYLLLCSASFLLLGFSSFCSTRFLQRSAGFLLLLHCCCLHFSLRKSSLRDLILIW